MNKIMRLCAWVLILSFLNLQVTTAALAVQNIQVAKAASITKHLPEMAASPEMDIPGQKPGEKKSFNWLWVALGAVILGVAAAGGGGGGGGGSSSTNPPASNNGAVNVGW
jgi:hypothetical protein